MNETYDVAEENIERFRREVIGAHHHKYEGYRCTEIISEELIIATFTGERRVRITLRFDHAKAD